MAMKGGRPKAFREDQVLEQAMDLFWRRGYKGAAISDLLVQMGISRQSLYDTFGNKRSLFIRVLDHYKVTRLSAALGLLEREGSDIENVKAIVRFFEVLGEDPECRGCLVANSLIELGPGEDEEISTLLRETLQQLQGAIERALRNGQAAGELAATKSPAQIARALTNSLVGMAVTGRLETGPADLRDVYAGTLSMLD
jgi:TetR/AcrR family transcriptional repressor of nem operon